MKAEGRKYAMGGGIMNEEEEEEEEKRGQRKKEGRIRVRERINRRH